MSTKRKIQMMLDIAMVILLPVLMAYSMVGEAVHEWAGMVMFVLFILHHVLNWRWLKNLRKGHYPPLRILGTVINLLLAVTMISLPVSGILMAKHTFSFLRITSGASAARTVHLLASYWGLALMSVHLGLHWNMIMSMMKKAVHIKEDSAGRKRCLRIAAILIAVYGCYVFFTRRYHEYMFLRTQFVFFDFDEPLFFFFADSLAVMGLFVCAGHYISKCIRR